LANILAIDTSTDTCSVSLGKDEEVFNFHESLPKQHTEKLLGIINSLMLESKLDYEELHAVAVGIGPGSYTGIRLSCAVAQGIAFAQGLKAITLSSLELLSMEANIKTSASSIVAISEANLGNIYIVETTFLDGAMESSFRFIPWQSLELNQFAEECIFIGDGCSLFSDIVNQLPDSSPRASYLLEAAQKRLNNGNTIRPEEILPIYLNDENSWKKVK
jgi:tRNA threonylcarbamoyladenosine biosynthesis protein TsaB